MEREKKDISEEIFEKIINDIKCYSEVSNIIPVGLGEPFLNKNWYKLFATIKKEFPSIPIYIVTNGVLLKPDITDKISHLLRSDDSLLISINSGNKEKYRIMMGLDNLDQVNQNVKYLLVTKKRGDSLFKIKLQFIRLKGVKKFFQLVFLFLNGKFD
jgi:MoaA/NifB/PqqE/SkfB family radical SAM enzyme